DRRAVAPSVNQLARPAMRADELSVDHCQLLREFRLQDRLRRATQNRVFWPPVQRFGPPVPEVNAAGLLVPHLDLVVVLVERLGYAGGTAENLAHAADGHGEREPVAGHHMRDAHDLAAETDERAARVAWPQRDRQAQDVVGRTGQDAQAGRIAFGHRIADGDYQ